MCRLLLANFFNVIININLITHGEITQTAPYEVLKFYIHDFMNVPIGTKFYMHKFFINVLI